jgi:hypothetical protein
MFIYNEGLKNTGYERISGFACCTQVGFIIFITDIWFV